VHFEPFAVDFDAYVHSFDATHEPFRPARKPVGQRADREGLDSDQGGGEADGCPVAADEFVGAHRDSAPLLEPVETAFDDVATLVALLLLIA